MKTFNQILSEIAEPRSPDEKRFKDKHKIEKLEGPGSKEQKASEKMSKDNSKAMSLKKGEDEAVYESADYKVGDQVTYTKGGKTRTSKIRKVEQKNGQTRYELANAGFVYHTDLDEGRSVKEESENLEERKAPKMKMIDPLKARREKDNDHDNAMGRTNTGRKKPTRALSSTRKSLDAIRKRSMKEGLNEAVIDDLEKLTKTKITQSGQRVSYNGYPFNVMDLGDGDVGLKPVDKDAEKELLKLMKAKFPGSKKIKNGMIALGESTQTLSELSKKILKSYAKKANDEKEGLLRAHEKLPYDAETGTKAWRKNVANKREAGIKLAHKKMNEEVFIEAFTAGSLKLDDGSTVSLNTKDAQTLNSVFEDLNSNNQKRMTQEAMKNKEGFSKILEFAKSAV